MRLLLLSILAVALHAATATADVYVLGLSHHFREVDSDKSNINPGLGLGMSYAVGEHLDITGVAMGYRDSMGHEARAMAGGIRGYLGARDGWHMTGAVLVGYMDGSGVNGAVTVPIIGAGFERVNIEAIYNPIKDVASAWVMIRWPL